jgi:hypothetical protein
MLYRVLAGVLPAWILLGAGPAAVQPEAQPDGITGLVSMVEHAIRSGEARSYTSLLAPAASQEDAREFIDTLEGGVTNVVVRERDRLPLRGGPDQRLVLDVFTERGDRARVSTWRLDVTPAAAASAQTWQILEQQRVANVEGLYRLRLNEARQFDVRNLTIRAEGLTLHLPEGTAFVAEADGRPTAFVLRGDGTMRFEPRPRAERGQLRIFSGNESLDTRFDAVFLRVNPNEHEAYVARDALAARNPEPREVERARQVFSAHVDQSFSLDLQDLSRESWSLSPSFGDLVAEIHTRKYDTLTYARSSSEAEDITLFDRRGRRNIALYPSEQKLAIRGRFYSEDDRVEYDVLDHQIDAAFSPEKDWLEGRAQMRLKVRSHALGTFTIRLADELTVRSVSSDRFGRLLGLRVRGQNNVIINLPEPLPGGEEMTLAVAYGGRILPQTVDREALQLDQQDPLLGGEGPFIPPEPRFLYSNRTYWYPQSTVSDFSTATLRLTAPAGFQIVATGERATAPPQAVSSSDGVARLRHTFAARQPVRYLSVLISRFTRYDAGDLPLQRSAEPAGVPEAAPRGTGVPEVALSIETNPRQHARARGFSTRATRILQFFSGLLGEFPYPSFTLALVENPLPGGHSPAYFAILHQPLPTSSFAWRTDPVSFDGYPDFFLSHELAHQWWGQAIGWKNYHEQWLSEGLAQYFAALYAREDRGDQTFTNVIKQMRRTAVQYADQGPISLGYRLGHLQSESRIFRALVYNKAAVVMHMLRGLLGDELFFEGLREFYRGSRFTKAGTEDLRLAFEKVSGRSLQRFFENWIYSADIPTVTYVVQETEGAVLVRFSQPGDVFEMPVPVRITLADGRRVETIVTVDDRTLERRVPVTGDVRRVEIDPDNLVLAEFKKGR